MPFSRACKITIDHTQVPSDQTDYTVVVAGVFLFLKNISNGGFVNDINGYDIAFFNDRYQDDQIFNYQLVPGTYDPTTGAVEFWVQIPSVSSTVDTVFYMFFDDPEIDFDNSGFAWLNSFKGAFPFANGTILDTTDYSLANWPDAASIVGSVSAVPGQIFGGAGFSAAADGLLDDSDGTFNDTYNNPTSIVFWLASNSAPTNAQLLSKTDNTTAGFLISLQGTDLLFTFLRGITNRVWTATGAVPADGAERRICITYTGNDSDGASGLLLYINGSLVTWDIYVDGSGAFVSDTGNNLQIGGSSFYSGASGRLDGSIDTLFYVRDTLSADYAAVDFADQKTASTLKTFSGVLLVAVINSFTAEPSEFIRPDTTNLIWSTTGAASANINVIGSVPVNGTRVWSISVTTFFELTVLSIDGVGSVASLFAHVGVAGSLFEIINFTNNADRLAQANAQGPFYENGYVYFIGDIYGELSSPVPFTMEIRATKSKVCQVQGSWDDSVGAATRPSVTYGSPWIVFALGLGCAEYQAPGIHVVYVAFTVFADPTLPDPKPDWLYLWELDLLTETWTQLGAINSVVSNPGWSVAIGVDATNGDCHMLSIPYNVPPPFVSQIDAQVYSRTLGFLPSTVVDTINNTTSGDSNAFTPQQVAVDNGIPYYFYTFMDFTHNAKTYNVAGPLTKVILPSPGDIDYALPHAISRPVMFGGNWYFTMPSTNTAAAQIVLFYITPGNTPTVINQINLINPVAVMLTGVGIQDYGACSQFFVLNGQLTLFWRQGPYDGGGSPIERFPDYAIALITNIGTLSMGLGTIYLFSQNKLTDGTGTDVGQAAYVMPYLIPDTGRLDVVVELNQLGTLTISLSGPPIFLTGSYIAGKGNFVLG